MNGKSKRRPQASTLQTQRFCRSPMALLPVSAWERFLSRTPFLKLQEPRGSEREAQFSRDEGPVTGPKEQRSALLFRTGHDAQHFPASLGGEDGHLHLTHRTRRQSWFAESTQARLLSPCSPGLATLCGSLLGLSPWRPNVAELRF